MESSGLIILTLRCLSKPRHIGARSALMTKGMKSRSIDFPLYSLRGNVFFPVVSLSTSLVVPVPTVAGVKQSYKTGGPLIIAVDLYRTRKHNGTMS
jgi:hypothetical protein